MKKSTGIRAAMILLSLSSWSQAAAIDRWPDTGQVSCYNTSSVISCPSGGQPFYGQDAQHSGPQPSYTKLDANNNALPLSAGSWSMVRDNITALTWEIKTDDGTLHDKDAVYSWCNSSSQNPGFCSGENNTEAFINSLNSARFGGHDDWRLPTILELATLLHSESRGPAINTTFFPNTTLQGIFIDYWSATEDTDFPSNAWFAGFADGGEIASLSKNSAFRARAVRGGTAASPIKYSNNQNGTISDKETGLMWQRDPSLEAAGVSGLDDLNWQSGLDYVARLNLIAFAGHSDWRLPNRNELQSLVDYSRSLPALNTDFFPTPPLILPWWTSTTEHERADKAWTVDFATGAGNASSKLLEGHVRAVRTMTFPLSVTRTGNGNSSVTSTPPGISCGTDCSEEYDYGTTVSMTATAAIGSIFTGWTGPCQGTGVCTLTMTQSRSVTATFTDSSSVKKSISPIYLLLLNTP